MRPLLKIIIMAFLSALIIFVSSCTSLPAAKLLFAIQPDGATSGSPFTSQPEVVVQNVNGNTVTSSDASVTLSIFPSSGADGATLSGTTTVNAVNGVAKFTNLSIDKAGTGYILMATSGTLESTSSESFATSPGAAAKLFFTVQPNGATSGSPFASQPEVAVQDVNGNTVNDSDVSVTLTIISDTGTTGAILSGTTTVKAVNGLAKFTNLSIDKAGTGYILMATSGSLGTARSESFTTSPGAAAKLFFTVQPNGVTYGSPFTLQPEVAVQDINGNIVTSSDASITLSISSGSGASGAVLSGTTTVKAVNGVAKFANLSIDKAGSGYKLMATSNGLTSAGSEIFEVTIDAVAAVWKYLLGFVKDDKGREFYNLLRSNIYSESATPYNKQDWWKEEWPKDSYYTTIFIFVDRSLYKPSLATASIVSTDPSLNGRLVAWFAYIVYSDGTVHYTHGTGYWDYYETTLSGKTW